MNNSFIMEIVNFIEDNIYKDFSLDNLENKFGISKSFLIKAFHVITTITIFEYVRNRRLYLAALDLINTDDKIIDISTRYVYERPECFTRAFKRRYGYTPLDFRNIKPAISKYNRFIVNINILGGDWSK